MAEEVIPYGRKTQRPSPVKDVHILWITAGLSCDGDTISITAATQPSIEDVAGSDSRTSRCASAQSGFSYESATSL